MTENVIVTIKGLHFDSGEKEAIEVINVGCFSEINQKIYIKYDEITDVQTMRTNNLIKIKEDRIEIIKKGPVSTHMIFTSNEKTKAFYDTMYGRFSVGITTKNVVVDRKEDAIDIRIDYLLEMNEEQFSECKVEISIRPQI